MDNLEVYREILNGYEVVFHGQEEVLLIEKEDMETFKEIAVWLSR